MLKIKNDTDNIIEATVNGTLQVEDFSKLGKTADELIKKHGKLRVLVDIADFNGWQDMHAAEQHFNFVKGHHQKVERLAVVTGQNWQNWIAAMARVFVHPDVEIFDHKNIDKAKKWIRG